MGYNLFVLCFAQSNWELHTAFFEAIVDVAAMIGPKSLDIVEALLQQVSLWETCEEIVSVRMAVLCVFDRLFFLFLSPSLLLSSRV